MEYNKIIIGFVVQSYRDGECVRQEFIASDEVSREDPATGESIQVDVKAEQYQRISLNEPKPTDIKLFVKEGELFGAADIKTTGQLMEQVARLMDKSCVYDIAGDVLFQAANGKFYTVHVEADVVEQDSSEVEIVLDEQLDRLDGDNEMYLPENMTADERIHVKLEALLRNRMDQTD